MQITIRQLLTEADALLDRRPLLLRAARGVRSLDDSARWMRLAMGSVRHKPLPKLATRLGWVVRRKYVRCLFHPTILAAALVVLRLVWLLPVCVFLFYLLESQRVFDLPLAIDGIDVATRRRARARPLLLRSVGGPWRAMLVTMMIAATMLFGGFAGRGFVRSWCGGCVAVVLWYEYTRQATADEQFAL